MSEENKNAIIKDIYYDKTGFGSVQSTYQKAHKKNTSITLKDVKDWVFKNVDETRKPKGYNSYINDEAYQEYQIDLIFFGAKKDDKDIDKTTTAAKKKTMLQLWKE